MGSNVWSCRKSLLKVLNILTASSVELCISLMFQCIMPGDVVQRQSSCPAHGMLWVECPPTHILTYTMSFLASQTYSQCHILKVSGVAQKYECLHSVFKALAQNKLPMDSICEKQTLFLLAIHLYVKPFKDFYFVLQTATLFLDTTVFTTNAHLNGCLWRKDIKLLSFSIAIILQKKTF